MAFESDNTVKFRVEMDFSGLPDQEGKFERSAKKMGSALENQINRFGSFGSALGQVFNPSLLDRYARVFTSRFGLIGGLLQTVVGRMFAAGQSASALATKLGGLSTQAAAAGSSALSSASGIAAMGASSAAVLGPIALLVAALGAIVLAIAGVGAGLFKATADASEWGLEIYKSAQKTRFATETLSAIKIVAQELHVSFDQLVRGIARFEVNINRGLTKPSTEAGKALKALKIDAAEAAKDPEKAFFQLTQKMEKMEDVTKRDRIALALMGRDFQTLIPALEAMGSGFGEAMEKAKRFGLLLSKDQTEALAKVSVAFTDIKLQLQGMLLQIGANFAPVALRALNMLSLALEKFGPWIIEIANAFGAWFMGQFDDLAKFVAVLATMPTILTEIGKTALVATTSFYELSGAVAEAALGVGAFLSGNFATAVSLGADVFKKIDDVTKRIKTQVIDSGKTIATEYAKNYLALTDVSKIKPRVAGTDDTDPLTGNAKHQLSEFEKLVQKFKHLRAEIDSFLNTGTSFFQLRMDVEDAENLKKNLDKIVSLRRELNLNPAEALPRNLESTKQLIDMLERYKRVRDDVKKAENESYRAAEELATLRLTRTIPILDAETRGQINYLKAVEDRRNAEQQLTADVAVQARLRADAIVDEVGSERKAYNELRLDAIKRAEDARVGAIKARIDFMSAFGGEDTIRQKLELSIPKQDTMVTHIQSIEKLVAEINAALHGRVNNPAGSNVDQVYGTGRGSAGYLGTSGHTLSDAIKFTESHGFYVTSTTGGHHNVGSKHYTGHALDVRTRNRNPAEVASFIAEAAANGFTVLDERSRPKGQKVWGGPHVHLQWGDPITAAMNVAAQASAMARGRRGRSPGTLDTSATRARRVTGGGEDNEIMQAFTNTFGVRLDELNGSSTRDVAIANGLNSLTSLKREQEALNAEAQVEAKIRSGALGSLRERLQLDVAILEQNKRRREEADAERTSIALLKRDLADIRANDPDAVGRVTRRAEQAHLLSQIDTANRIIELQYDIAHAAEGASDRYQVAWLESIKEVQQADEDAAISMIRNQTRIADQSVFHVGRARAAIMDHVASAKGLTDIFSDAVTDGMDRVGDGISSLLGKVNSKLGGFGSWITQIESSLIRMVTNRLIMRFVDMLLGGGDNSGGGGSVGIFGSATGATRPRTVGGGGVGNAVQTVLQGLFGGGGSNGGSFGFPGGIIMNAAGSNGVIDLGNGSIFDPSSSGSRPRTVSGNAEAATSLQGVLKGLIGGGGSGARSSAGFSFGSLAQSLGPLAPLLGFSIGTGVGAGSKTGSILGGIGGLAGGLGLLAGLGAISSVAIPGAGAAIGLAGAIPGLSGLFAGLGGALGGSLGAVVATAGPLAAIAAPLLIGAFLLSRNAKRRKEEEIRNTTILNAFDQLDRIKRLVETHRLDGAEGVTQALSVRQQYVDQMSQLKDKKTRSHALADVSRLDLKIDAIKKAATIALNEGNRDKLLVPEFATGGIVPGPFGAPRLVLAHGGEKFLGLNASHSESPNVTAGSNGGSQQVSLNVELSLGTDTQNELFVNGAKSTAGYKVIVKQVNNHKKYDQLESIDF